MSSSGGHQRTAKEDMNTNKAATPRLLKVPMVCEELELGRTKVYQLIASGRLPTVRIGRALRVRRIDLDRFVESLASEGRDDE